MADRPSCDVCGKHVKRIGVVWAYGIETGACDKCRGLEMEGKQTAFRTTIDGGIERQLPVEVDGWWDSEGGYNLEAVSLVHEGKTYNLIDVIKDRTIERIEERIEQDYG